MLSKDIKSGLQDLILDRESFINDENDKDNIFVKDKKVLKSALDYIEQLESAKGIKEALELANMSVKDFVYFKHRAEELEAKEQNLIEKLEENLKLIEDGKYNAEAIKIFLKSILNIVKGEKE